MQNPRAEAGPVMDGNALAMLFHEDGFPPIDVSVDDQVTVTMSAKFRVDSIRIHRRSLDDAKLARLERAVAEAVNLALDRVVELTAERLDAMVGLPDQPTSDVTRG